MKLTLVAVLLFALSCSSMHAPDNPVLPVTERLYSVNELIDQYEASEWDQRTFVRNVIIEKMVLHIDANYQTWIDALSSNKAAFDAAADFTALGLTAGATIVGGEGTKVLLAGLATIVQGGKQIVDKNLFYDQTVQE